MIHGNIYFMFEIPNANYNNNLSNAIVVSIVIFFFIWSVIWVLCICQRENKAVFLNYGFLLLAKADTNIRYCGSRSAVLITEE